MNNHQISIKNPCSENWNAMKPSTDGRFCDSCQKTVVNFTQMTDAEVLAFFEQYRGQKICGRMRKGQLNRPLEIATLEQNDVPVTFRRSSFAWRAALIGLALTGWLSGSTVVANAHLSNNVRTEWVETLPNLPERAPLSGKVLVRDGKMPIAAARVQLYAGEELLAAVQTDTNGVFEFRKLDLSKHSKDLTVRVQAEGYESTLQKLNAKTMKKPLEILLQYEFEIMGEVWIDDK